MICLQGRVVFSSSATEDFKCPFILLAEVEVKLELKHPVTGRGEAAILCGSEGYGELQREGLHSLGACARVEQNPDVLVCHSLFHQFQR